MNMMLMSDENHRDVYVSTVAMPPPWHCRACRRATAAPGETPTPREALGVFLGGPQCGVSPLTPPSPAGEAPAACLRHGFLLHTKFQVVYPFPTFQPAFQLRKDHVVLLNTSFSLVACAITVHPAGTPGLPDTPRAPPRNPRALQVLGEPLGCPKLPWDPAEPPLYPPDPP